MRTRADHRGVHQGQPPKFKARHAVVATSYHVEVANNLTQIQIKDSNNPELEAASPERTAERTYEVTFDAAGVMHLPKFYWGDDTGSVEAVVEAVVVECCAHPTHSCLPKQGPYDFAAVSYDDPAGHRQFIGELPQQIDGSESDSAISFTGQAPFVAVMGANGELPQGKAMTVTYSAKPR